MKKLWMTLIFALAIGCFPGESSAALPAPQMTYDLNGLSLSMTWTSVPGAAGYNLYYAPYPFAGNDTISHLDVDSQTSFNIDLWEGAAYYIAVRAYDGNGIEGAYSNIEDFIATLPAPGAPTVSYTVTGLNFSASWPEVPTASGYRLSYSSSASFEPGTTGSIDLGHTTSISYDLWPGASYYVAVQAYNNSGLSALSNDSFFNMAGGSAITSSQDFILRIIETIEAKDNDGAWQAIIIDEKLTTADVIEPALNFDGEAPTASNNLPGPDTEISPDEVTPGNGTSSAEILIAADLVPDFVPSGDYWFAFVDLEPFASFEHVALYIFGNAATGEISVNTEGSWPEINGEAIYLTGKATKRLFSPAIVNDDYPNPDGDANITPFYYLITPDYGLLQANARLLIRAPDTSGHLNILVDNNNDGSWTSNAGNDEWLLKNSQVSKATGWSWTEQFSLPLDDNNKFGYQNWSRVVWSTQTLDLESYNNDGWSNQSGVGLSDSYFNFLPWGGPGYDADDFDATALGPLNDSTPVVPNITPRRAIDDSYICKPEGISIPTKTQALVINLGDSPGNSWMQRNGLKAKAGFELLLGDGVAQFLDKPTRAEALSAVTELFSDMTCLDEKWLYITGHGEKTQGALSVENGGGWLEWHTVMGKLDGSSNCPTEMNYYEDECRQPGYCNINMIIQGCYSGHWQQGKRWGVNMLSSADKKKPSYGRGDGNGSFVSNEFWNAFLGDADLRENGGNQDGEVSNQEAMRYARDNHGGTSSGSTTSLGSNCDCTCESGMSSSTGMISLAPDTVSFVHQYGVSSCPQNVGSVQVLNEGGGAFNWSLGSSLPPWLSASTTSGTDGATINLNFTCDGWTPSMSANLSIMATDASSGTPLSNSPASLSVSGSVQGY